MKLLTYFRDFMVNTVNLKQKKLDLLDKHVDAIVGALGRDLTFGPMLLEHIPQGSWMHRTIIEPLPGDEFDADILVRLEYQPGWEPKEYVQALRAAFTRTKYKDKIASKKDRCVRIVYAGDCHVDVVPHVEHPLYGSVICNQTLNQWESTNPGGFTAWMLKKDTKAQRNLRKTIRLMKYLRDYKNTFSVPSVILTTLLGERINEWDPDDRYKDLPTALFNLVNDLDKWLQLHPTRPSITDPSCTATNFDHRWTPEQYTNFRDKIHGYAAKITDAYNEADKETSLALWQEIFGPEFEKAPVEDKATRLVASLTKRGDDTEEFIDQRFPVDIRYRLDVKCRVANGTLFEGFLRVMRCKVKKGRTLDFTVANCAVPAPYRVFWKVRNSGDEAEQRTGGLRGEITERAPNQIHNETTSYLGSHYVECYIVKDGVVVASAHHPVIVVR